MENKLDNMKYKVKDTLSCFICTAKVFNPVICSQCKILFCSKCIQKWFNGRKECESPCCKVQISLENMIPIPFMNYFSEFFIKEIDNKKNNDNINNINEILEEKDGNPFINSNDNNKILENKNNQILDEYCPKHKDKIIEFFCLNCNTKHCSKCLMFINEESKIHKNHKIISKEQKNKYNIDEIKNDIENLSITIDKCNKYKNNIELESEIIKQYLDFFNNMIKELENLYHKNIDNKKYQLYIKKQSNQNRLKNIMNYRNNYENIVHSFLYHNDEVGLKAFFSNLNKYKDTSKFKYLNNINIDSIPYFKIYVSEFYETYINENNENIGEINFNFSEINKIIYFKISLQNNELVFLNLLIELNNLENNNKSKYYANLLVKNKNNILSYPFKENIIQDGFYVISKTLTRETLRNFIDEDNKCHAQLILCVISNFSF